MIKSVVINGVSYGIDEGLALQDKATEELDSMTFSISNIQEISLEPFQNVVITFNDDRKRYMLVNTWVEESAGLFGLKRYIINCISETKKLERIQMPNMTITQPLGLAEEDKRKYDTYLRKSEVYIKKVYPELSYDIELVRKMTELTAVEEQFNSPNAKEYLNSILNKISGVCRVENNKIGYLDLSKKNNAINQEKILFSNESQTIEDYYSDIRTDLQGVQSERSTLYKERVGIRAPESAVLTYDNAVIELSHNINYIEEVRFIGEVKINGVDTTNVSCVIYNKNFPLIREKAVYDTLLVSNDVGTPNGNLLDYKRYNLFYTRGSNKIEGLGYNESTWFIGMEGMLNALENVVNLGLINNLGYEVGTVFLTGDMRDFTFEVTYSALDDVATEFSKEKSTKSVIRDNQVDSYVDLDKFAKTQKEKINRLGNSTLEINARYNSLEEVPELFDYIGDYVLAEREIVYHRDYIDFKGVLYKDYVKKNLFYGVNAKRRSTQLIMGNEAVMRKELTKETYKFSYNDKGGNKRFQRYVLGNVTVSQEDNVVGNVSPYDFFPIQIAGAVSIFDDGSQTNLYKLEPDVRKGGMSVFVNFKWYDNINVGMKILFKEKGIINTLFNSKGGYEQQYVPYTDSNGELRSIYVYMWDAYKDGLKSQENVDKFPDVAIDLLDNNWLVYSKSLERFKDNREILNETFQFEFASEDGIIVTERFVETMPFFANSKEQLWLVTSTDKIDKYRTRYELGENFTIQYNMGIDSSDIINFHKENVLFNRIKLYNNNVDLTGIKSWSIVDKDANILIGVNKRDIDDVIPLEIYLNKEE